MSIYTLTPEQEEDFSSLKNFVIDPLELSLTKVDIDPLHLEWCRLGGLVQGKINADTGHMSRIQKLSDVSDSGKKGAEVCRALGVNSFFNDKLRIEVCKLGGKKQGKINSESDHLSKISQKYWDDVRSGKKQRIKKVWCYSDIERRSILIKDISELPEGYVLGRKIKFD